MLTKEDYRNLRVLLERVNVQGNEVKAVAVLMHKLEQMLQVKDDDNSESNESGAEGAETDGAS